MADIAGKALSTKEWIQQVLDENSSKNFVKRILKPKNYPTLDIGNGDIATHKMAWSD